MSDWQTASKIRIEMVKYGKTVRIKIERNNCGAGAKPTAQPHTKGLQ